VKFIHENIPKTKKLSGILFRKKYMYIKNRTISPVNILEIFTRTLIFSSVFLNFSFVNNDHKNMRLFLSVIIFYEKYN